MEDQHQPTTLIHLKVLIGLRVLRLGQARCGDFLCQILSDAGARIETLNTLGEGAPDIVVNDLGRGVEPPAGFALSQMAPQRAPKVYCNLISFPQGGPMGLPELEDAPILATMGLNRMQSGPPRPEPLPIPSYYAALMASILIVCGLMPGRHSGPTVEVEVSLFAAAMNILGRKMIRFDDPALRDPQSVNLMLPVSRMRRCADGRYLQPQGRYPNLVRRLFCAAGHPEWAEAAAAGLEYLATREELDLWNARMDAMFLARPAAEWEQVINEAGGAATMVRSHAEWRKLAQPHVSGIFFGPAEVPEMTGPGCVLHDGPPGSARGAPSAGHRPLAGVRVLDLTIIIAGPSMGRILADLGAEVTRIDAPDRVVNPILWMELNRGKRSLVLDLAQPEARTIARELAANSDVVVENFRFGKLERLGMGYRDVVRDNPSVIYASGNLFDQTGPWADRPGWDHNAQAATGMSQARAVDGRPRCLELPVNDFATGLLGALGVVLGLLHRDLTGKGARAAVSLARSATILQQRDLVQAPAVRESGLRVQTIECRGGWVSIYSRPGEALPPALWDDAKGIAPQDLCNRLVRQGLAAAVENTVADLIRSTVLDDTGIRHRWQHPDLGPFTGTVPTGRIGDLLMTPRDPAPLPGQDNARILAEVGRAADLPRLAAEGVVGGFDLFGQRKWASEPALG